MGGKPETMITLYHASWCGPCRAFAPLFIEITSYKEDKASLVSDEAREAVNLIEQAEKKIGPITLKHFEEQTHTPETTMGLKITSFPTIIISKINKNGKMKHYEYQGQRNYDSIVKALPNPDALNGGEPYGKLVESELDSKDGTKNKTEEENIPVLLPMTGGGNNMAYAHKYYKYKAKYMKLKNL
jgi:thiol-disulfide isomerase/thioredoxin